MRAKLNFRQALPMTVLSASLAMVACDFGSDSKETRDNNPVLPGNSIGEGSNESSVVETAEDLLNCTESREGNIAKVLSENAFYECESGRWNKVTAPKTTPSDTSSNGISSSDISPSGNSSAGETQMSSSSWAIDTPPTAAPAAHCFEPWIGDNGSSRINTGYDNGTETSGYWYTYGDDSDGGISVIEWPIPLVGYDPDWLDPVIDYCGGICGKYILSKGILEYSPFAALGFNLAGLDDPQGNGNPVPVDASAMGGIIVTYTSDAPIRLELGLGETKDKEIGFNNPSVTLPKALSPTAKAFSWSQFKQASWGSAEISGEEASKILVALHFVIQGKDGLTGEFNIMRIEAYNPWDCASFVPPVFSSSSKNVNSSSSTPHSSSSSIHSSSSSENAVGIKPSYTFETWIGDNGAERIFTGFETDTDNGGYWYEYNDSEDGGKSKINWETPLGNEYDEKSFQPVIDVCAGVCGNFQLDKGDLSYDPYVGIAFDLAGHDANGKLVLADASSMEGVCIGYISEAPITVEMSLGEAKDKELEYDVPIARLMKSSTYKVQNIPWEKFTRSGWGKGKNVTGDQAAKTLGSLRFKIQGKDGTKGNFNIMTVGPYRNSECSLYAAPPVLP